MSFNVNPDIHDPKYNDIDKLYVIQFKYILYTKYTFVKNICPAVLRCVRKCMAEGSNCLFKVFFEGKWS